MPDNLRILNFDGDVSISSIAGWQELIRSTLAQGLNCIFNLSRSTGADLSVIQLILAAKIHAASLKLNCQIAASVSQEILECAWLCGIIDRPDYPPKSLDRAFDDYLGPKV